MLLKYIVLAFLFFLLFIQTENLIVRPRTLLPVLNSPPKYKYKYYPMMNSPGNNIRQNIFGDIDTLKKTCDSLPNCAGYNTDGYLKYNIEPKSQWNRWGTDPARGLYTKI